MEHQAIVDVSELNREKDFREESEMEGKGTDIEEKGASVVDDEDTSVEGGNPAP